MQLWLTGTSHERTVAHAVLYRRHLPRLVLPRQPHPRHCRHVVRRLSETRARTRWSRDLGGVGNYSTSRTHTHTHVRRNKWRWVNIVGLIYAEHEVSIKRWCSGTGIRKLVAWHSGRTSVCERQTFPILGSTYSWRVTTYVDKPSAIGQPTKPTQLSSFLGR